MKIKTMIGLSIILAASATMLIVKSIQVSTSLEKLLLNTEITDLNAVTLDKSELKDKVVIFSYFQTWCSDCAKEQPDLVKLQERYGNQLKILFVSDEPVELIMKFKEKFQSKLNFYHTSVPLKKNGIVSKFPTTYLIDRKGNIKDVKVEGIHWYTPETIAMIEQMLAQ